MSASCNSPSWKMSPNDLVLIPGGEFLMGQQNGRDDERPAHRVRVAPFRLARFQVTNADYGAPGDPSLPVTNVNWFDAVAFCERIGRARERGGATLSLGRRVT